MGYESTIYGCIFGVAYGAGWDERDERMDANRAVIEGLPADDAYPQLTVNMFHVTGTRYGHPGLMRYQPIPFGLALKNFFEEWDIWLGKFEALLARLAFDHAELHLDASGIVDHEYQSYAHHYTWKSHYPKPGWTFGGGERVLGTERARFEAWVPEAEAELRAKPDDPLLLVSLFGAYARLGRSAEARDAFARLHAVDPDRAASVSEHPYWMADCLPEQFRREYNAVTES